MSRRHENMVVTGIAELSNESASVQLVAQPGSTLYLFLERLDISVSKAATGGGGEIIVKNSTGDTVWRVNADGVKDVSLNWGEEGVRTGPGEGLVAVTANAQGNQAQASVAFVGHLAFR